MVCGNEVTCAIIHPSENKADVEHAYKCAVKADAFNSTILRNYKIFHEWYDKHGDGKNLVDCPLCIGKNNFAQLFLPKNYFHQLLLLLLFLS